MRYAKDMGFIKIKCTTHWLIPAFLLSYFEKGIEAVLNHHTFVLAGGTLLWSAVALIAGVVFEFGAYGSCFVFGIVGFVILTGSI